MKNLLKKVNICHIGIGIGLAIIGHAIYKIKKDSKELKEVVSQKVEEHSEKNKIVEVLAETNPEDVTLAKMQKDIDVLSDDLVIAVRKSKIDRDYIFKVCLGISIYSISLLTDIVYRNTIDIINLRQMVIELTASNTWMATAVGFDAKVIDKNSAKEILESLLDRPVSVALKEIISNSLEEAK